MQHLLCPRFSIHKYCFCCILPAKATYRNNVDSRDGEVGCAFDDRNSKELYSLLQLSTLISVAYYGKAKIIRDEASKLCKDICLPLRKFDFIVE